MGERAPLQLRMLAWLVFGAWRWRRQLAPLAAVTALVGTAAIGHAMSAELAWAPAVLGAVVAGAIVLFGHRPIHRYYAAIASSASAWLALAWAIGLASPVMLGALAVLAIGSSAIWLAHHLPRSRIEVHGGSRNPLEWGRWRFRQRAKHQLRIARRDWPGIASAAKLPGVEVRRAATDITWTENMLVLDRAGWSHADLMRVRERIASGLRAPRMSVRFWADRDYEHLSHLYWAREDPPGWQPPAAGAERAPADRDGEEAGPESEDDVTEDGVIVGLPRARTRDHAPARAGKVGQRTDRLRAAVAGLGGQTVTAAELAMAAGLPPGWVAAWLPRLADEIGLEEAPGGWRRSGIQAGGGS